MTEQRPQHVDLDDKNEEATDKASSDTFGFGTAPTSTPEASRGDAPSHLKICKGCMKTQPATGAFCVYCGSKDLTVIQTVQQESYLHQTVAGKFKIVDFIDKGGMGEVYLGKNEAIGQKVAIKFLFKKFAADEHLVMRFLNEARSYCKVNHPNAVTLLEYGQHTDGALYIITEFIEGKSLSKTLKATGPFDLTKVISIGKQLCEVLTAAHDQGVIHRDLKPDNIMLTPGPRDRYQVKVLDFGIAKITDEDAGPMTETGAIFGTPEFMSPEQARGDSATPRSDLYAIGLILFYMVTGKLPFKGKNKFAVLHSHINDEAPTPSSVAPYLEILPELEAIILRCLRKDPAERFEDADALYDALESLRAHEGIRSTTHMSLESIRANAPGASISTSGDQKDVSTDPLDPAEEARLDAAFKPPTGDAADQWPDIHDSKEAIEMADTLSPHDTPADVHFDSIDMSKEYRGDLASDVSIDDDDDFDLYPQPSMGKRVVGGLILGCLIAAVGVGAWKISKRPAVAPTPKVDASKVDNSPDNVDVQKILITGQVLALLTTAQDALDNGNLDKARQQIEASRLWLADEDLPKKGMVLRLELEKRLTGLTASDDSAQKLLLAGQCKAVLTVANSIQGQSQGLAASWRERAMACLKKSKKSRGGRSPGKTKGSNQPASLNTSIKDILPTKPDAKVVQPPSGDGKINGKPPAKLDAKAPVGPGDKTSQPETTPKTDSKADPKTDAKKPVPDGMALPPKTL